MSAGTTNIKLYFFVVLFILNWTNAILSENLSKNLMLMLLPGGSEITYFMYIIYNIRHVIYNIYGH